jgi:NAD(P)-dependent dehydrogenase (short-subunit alcohol dehydrogenase family)
MPSNELSPISFSSDRLRGRTIVVTGAASGIGAEISRRCLKEGAIVVAVDSDDIALAALESAGEGELPLTTFVADTRDVQRANEIMDRLDADGIVVSGFVACAGILGPSSFLNANLTLWHHVLDVNLFGTIVWARSCVPRMLNAGYGSIVFLGSQLLHGGGRENVCYVASKGAIRALSRSLALEYATSGIRVNTLSPGATDTPLLRNGLKRHADPAAAQERSKLRHAMHRIGQPAEIAAAACFLLSDDASFITGTELLVDGGYSVA